MSPINFARIVGGLAALGWMFFIAADLRPFTGVAPDASPANMAQQLDAVLDRACSNIQSPALPPVHSAMVKSSGRHAADRLRKTARP